MKHNLLYFFNAIVTLLGGVESKYKANDHAAYQTKCPYCLKNGSVLGMGRDRSSYVLLCPNCVKGYSLHQLIQDHGSDDLKEDWWKHRSGWIDYKQMGYPIKHRSGGPRGRRASFRDKMRVAAEMAVLSVMQEANKDLLQE
jgi:hypothetical protein